MVALWERLRSIVRVAGTPSQVVVSVHPTSICARPRFRLSFPLLCPRIARRGSSRVRPRLRLLFLSMLVA